MPTILATGTTAVTSTAWSEVLNALTAQISVSAVMGVIAAAVTAGIGLVFAWWGVRKTARVIMSAFRSGKFRI